MDGGPDSRSLALETARALYLSGVNTSTVIESGERLADRLGSPGRVDAQWGSLQLVTAEHHAIFVEACPEVTNMSAAQAVEDAERAFSDGRITADELSQRVAAAEAMSGPPLLPFVVAAGVGAVALILLWGLKSLPGLVLVALAAAAGAVARRVLGRYGVGLISQTFVAALVGGLVGGVASRLTSWSPAELVALGPALILVPGPQLMNGGLDVSGGRIPLGIARLTYAITTIFAISAGVLLGLAAAGRTLPVTGPRVELSLPADVACAAVAAGCYAVYFHMPWRLLPVPVVVGGAAHLVHSLLVDYADWNLAVASGVGALFAGVVLLPLASRLRVPFAGVGFASVVAMMPSVYIHRGVSGLLELIGRRRADPELLQSVVVDAATAVLVIVALVLGTVLPIRIYRALHRHVS